MSLSLVTLYRRDVTIELAVPSYAESGGDCAENRQELFFTWNWLTGRARRSTERENKVTFAWTPTDDDQFALSSMAMNIRKTSAVIEDLHPQEEDTNATASVDQLSMFAAPKGQSHACGAASSVDLGNGAGITLSDVHLQAFNRGDETISAAVSCPQPRAVSNGIYIAVSAILGGFALAGVIGYIVYRVRTRGSDTTQFHFMEDKVA